MTSREIREKFLNFFEKNGHKIVPSSSLLPKDDPSVLLTSAGMQQFKPYYVGKKDPIEDFGSQNTISVQKSFRTSDIDEVGDESHLTFFEMLGNFSFGGYFKEEAIKFGWEFITKELKITPERIYVSVFEGDSEVPADEESIAVWKSLGVSVNRIKKAGRSDNFWGPTGNEGPCGPTSEIYVDGLEVWNIVFNQYYCQPDKTLKPLKQNGVDTGMGFERLAMIVQGAPTIFETDLFRPLIELISHRDVPDEPRSVRIIADHARAAAFLIADGVMPSNIGTGYVLRRIIRRAIRHGRLLELESNFLILLSQKVIELYKKSYPELSAKREDILTVIQKEEEKFSNTLGKGLKEFEKLILQKSDKIVSGNDAFYLYESYGFPMELTRELALEKGFAIDESGWKTAFKAHQEISRVGAGKKFGGHGLTEKSEIRSTKSEIEDIEKITRLHTATHLLHQALHDVLDKEADVKQMGSDINVERARFDFTFPRKLTTEELKKVEETVNQKIDENLPITVAKLSLKEALVSGARAFFKEKYPDEVTVYSVGDYSREICGGPHIKKTGEIGHFKIIKEESSSAGVRRIRAVVE